MVCLANLIFFMSSNIVQVFLGDSVSGPFPVRVMLRQMRKASTSSVLHTFNYSPYHKKDIWSDYWVR